MVSLQYACTELTTPTMRQSSRWFASLPVRHVCERSLAGASVPLPSEYGSEPPPPPVTFTPSSASTTMTMTPPTPPPTARPRPPGIPRRSWTWPVSSLAPGRNRTARAYPRATPRSRRVVRPDARDEVAPDHRHVEEPLDARVEDPDLRHLGHLLDDDRAREPFRRELLVEVAQRLDLEERVQALDDPLEGTLHRRERHARVEHPAPQGEVHREPLEAPLAECKGRIRDEELGDAVDRARVALHEVERVARLLAVAGHEAQEGDRMVVRVERDREQEVRVLAADVLTELHREAALGRLAAPALADR